jgi:hypothetical protein
MSKNQELQRHLRQYREESGNREVDMKEFAAWLLSKGWPAPKPISAVDRLAKECSAAAREETRTDVVSGNPYRVNHMYVVTRGDEQLHLWVEIDEAPREQMHASLTMRREQIVGDVTQLSFDAEHWNRINPEDEPIEIEKDFNLDFEIRRNYPTDG